MANSDYIKRNLAAGFCPKATISGALGQLDTSVTIANLVNNSGVALQTNRAALIGQEIVSITAIAGSVLTIGRGCCDTVPAAHADGSTIWFFDDYIASDRREYGPTDVLSVKPLTRTLSGGEMPVSASPPRQVNMNHRFARPYPPGLVLVNSSAWYTSGFNLTPGAPNLVMTWASRNRITQQDTLVPHGTASITPEAGTTYRIKIRNTAGGLAATIDGISTTGYTFTRNEATAALGGASEGYLELFTVRDGLESWQPYRIDFTYTPGYAVTKDLAAAYFVDGVVGGSGWGNDYGNNWGTIA